MTLSNNQVAIFGIGCLLIVILIAFVPIIPDSNDERVTILEAVQELNLTSDLSTNPDPSGDEVGMCIEIFDPYCGDDGVTYGNLCQLELTQGVQVAFKGEC